MLKCITMVYVHTQVQILTIKRIHVKCRCIMKYNIYIYVCVYVIISIIIWSYHISACVYAAHLLLWFKYYDFNPQFHESETFESRVLWFKKQHTPSQCFLFTDMESPWKSNTCRSTPGEAPLTFVDLCQSTSGQVWCHPTAIPGRSTVVKIRL